MFVEHEGEGGITRALVDAAMEEEQRSVGLHFAQGHEVWQLCREIAAERLDEDDALDDASRALAKEQALRTLFCAQMQLPLAENDLAMSEFRAWNTYNALEPDAEKREAVFVEAETTQTKMFAPIVKKLKSFEQTIAAGFQDPVEAERAWLQYVNYATHRVAPLLPSSRAKAASITGVELVVCVFERAVAALCLYPSVWAKYVEYVAAATGESDDNQRLLELCRRAVRNVSFDSTAWVELLLAMEQSASCSHESIVALVEDDLLSRTDPLVMDQYHFLNVLLAFCDLVRRHAATSSPGEQYTIKAMETVVEPVFTTSEAFLTRVFPDFVHGVSKLYEYHAKLWLFVDCDDTVKKHKWQSLWQHIIALRGSEAEAWVTFYQESARASGLGLLTRAEIRSTVFEEGLKQVKDYLLSLVELWVVFEREHGDLESFLRAKRRRSALMLAATSTQLAEPSSAASTTSKRKLNGTNDGNSDNAKRAKYASKEQQQRQEHKQSSKSHAEQMQKPKPKPKPKPATDEKDHGHERFTNDNTVFVCNLSKQATEEDIKALFADIPSLKDVRLVVKLRGDRAKSRGMAYVQFTDAAGVDQGLTRDGQVVQGQPISVKRSEPPSASSSAAKLLPTAAKANASGAKAKSKAERDGTWKTDPCTVYVGGLNGDKSEDGASVDVADDDALVAAIKRAMDEAGEASVVVTRACILKDKRGRPKNYGLVEVGSSDQVSVCLSLAAEVQSVLGPKVTMKPSRFSITEILEQQQQQQKATKGPPANATARKPKDKKARLPDGVAHDRPSQRLALPSKAVTTSATSMSLMPRALRRKKEAAAATPASSEAGEAKKPMTNDDFRQLMMNK
jgi:hypothetical protein